MYRVVSLIAGAATVEVGQAFFGSQWWRGRLARTLELLRRLPQATDDAARQQLMQTGGASMLGLSLTLGLFLVVAFVVIASIPLLMGLNQRSLALYITFLGIGSVGWLLIRSKFIGR